MKFNLIPIVVSLINLLYTQSGIEFQINSEKSVYYVDEPIYIEIEKYNSSGTPITCSKISETDSRFIEINLSSTEHGKIENKLPNINFYVDGPLKGIELAPGKSIYNVFLLNSIQNFQNTNQPQCKYINRIPPGHYSLKVINHNNYNYPYERKLTVGNSSTKDVDKMTIESNEIQFTIMDLVDSQIEENAFYADICCEFWSPEFSHDYVLNRIDKFIQLYPESIYEPMLIWMYLKKSRRIFQKNPELTRSWNDKVERKINNYLNSFFIFTILAEIGEYKYEYNELSKQGEVNTTKTMYQMLRDDYPNTKLYQYVNSKLIILSEKRK